MFKGEPVIPMGEKQMYAMSCLTLWNTQCRYNLIGTLLLRNSLRLTPNSIQNTEFQSSSFFLSPSFFRQQISPSQF